MGLEGCEMNVSIVIPCYNHSELVGQVLMDIYQNCSADEVLVVDDCSTNPQTKEIYGFWKRLQTFPLKTIELTENVGFLKASNIGMKAATGDIIALISNDVRINKDVVKIAKEIIKTPDDKVLLGGRLLDYDTGWNTFDGKIHKYIEGWALIATKSGWEELGYFDERFAPWDYEDIDLSTTALSKGYEIRQFSPYHGDVLEHLGAKSIGYTDERRAITETHRELFRQKWITRNLENK